MSFRTLRDPVLLHQVLDDVLLVAVDPSREGQEQHLQGMDIGRHRSMLPCLIPPRGPGTGSAEYSDPTRSAGPGRAGSRWS
jgi:hypothetical protein